MTYHTYFLVFRTKQRGGDLFPCFEWDNPTGGVVMDTNEVCHGVPVPDLQLASAVAKQMWHCAPWETLVLAEVLDPTDQCTAWMLAKQYERDLREVAEILSP